MQLLEHDSKRLLAHAGLAIPRGELADTPAYAQRLADCLGGEVAVKAQVPVGGRGKAGGIAVVPAEHAGEAAERLLNGDVRGHAVSSVLVEQALRGEREYYLAVTVDARLRRPVLLLGAHGGIDVESTGETIAGVPFTLKRGLDPGQAMEAAVSAGIAPAVAERLLPVAQALERVFRDEGAQVVEVNPAVEAGGGFVALDARIVPDPARADAEPTGSRALGFDYIVLDPDGEVGLITTGAGASMLVIDLLAEAGLEAVDFCDLRTGSLRGDPARLLFVLDELARAPALAVIVVNVFAGVTDLAEFADLLARALRERPPAVPVVARMEGRGVAAARAILAEAGCRLADSPESLVAAAAELVRDRQEVA